MNENMEQINKIINIIDIEKEKQRLEAKIRELGNNFKITESRLKSENFVKKAPSEILEQEKERLNTFSQHKDKLIQQLKKLQS